MLERDAKEFTKNPNIEKMDFSSFNRIFCEKTITFKVSFRRPITCKKKNHSPLVNIKTQIVLAVSISIE